MTCYEPIVAYSVGKKKNGALKLLFAKGNNRYSDVFYDEKGISHPEYEKLLLPCGHCIGCLMKRSRDWTIRLVHEMEYSTCASFVTLTYDEEHVPRSKYIDDNGEEQESMTLSKRDVQLFMKRLRKRIGNKKIRYFLAGEYGGKTKRPHYHMIIFNYDFPDKKLFQVNDGYALYRSNMLEDIWKLGFSSIAEVNFATCSYVAKYCLKKKYGSHNMYYRIFNLEPEFNLMSRRPGIGYQWIKEHQEDVFSGDYKIRVSTDKGGITSSIPKYYDRIYSVNHEKEIEELKRIRKESAKYALSRKIVESGLDMFEMLENEKTVKEKMMKKYEKVKI